MAYYIAIDVGNSRSKFALFEGRDLQQLKTFDNQELSSNHELFQNFEPEAVIISSVNAEAEKKLQIENFAAKLLRLTHKTPLPFKLDYQSPETLGKDRIAAVAGAMVQFPAQDILVIDAGTCITYDFLTKNKSYRGGAISPGIQMRLKAMNHFTHSLPLLSWDGGDRPKVLGNTTITSMISGAVNGVIQEIIGFIEGYKAHYNDLKILLTGGDVKLFEKELKNGIFADPNLVLKGLNEILIYNRE